VETVQLGGSEHKAYETTSVRFTLDIGHIGDGGMGECGFPLFETYTNKRIRINHQITLVRSESQTSK
jgi:hypothetical protein